MVSTLPAQASVVVIGGGIMGCSTLYHLAKMGVRDAILLERNQLTSGTTWHSAAQVRALRHSQNLTQMIRYSIDLYSQLERETGQSVGWIQEGSLSLATNPERLTHIQRQQSLAQAFGVNASNITAAQAKERWPMMNADDVLGAVWSADDGRVSPSDVCAALIKAAKMLGAQIFEHTAVTGITTKNGRVQGLETTQGSIRCDAIAVCAGLWSREVGAMAGADVPLLACEHFYLLTKPIEGISGNLPTLSDHDNHLYIRDDSGGLLVGCFEPQGKPIAPGILDKHFSFGLLEEDWAHFEPMMHNALKRLPALEHAQVKMLLNGPESFTPDGAFMLGETAQTPGLFLGCGMNSVGIACGGGAGMNLAHCIVHGHTAYDLSEADAKRFAPVFNHVEHLMARAPEILGAHYEISYPGRQRHSARNLRRLPLDTQHRADKAHMGQYYGWERPLYFAKAQEPRLSFQRPDWFEQVGKEVLAAHTGAALFDASSFGKIEVQGVDAEKFMRHLCAGFVSRPVGSVIYSALLNTRGTFESDITAQRIAIDHYRLFVGTTAIQKDSAWLRAHSAGFDVAIEDSTQKYAQIALMGPHCAQILRAVGAAKLTELEYFQVGPAHIANKHVRAARMSYVGELGWEITCLADNAQAVYAALKSAGAVPAGLFAQTSMRIEKGFCAMGHELDADITPIDVGLDFAVRKSAGFIGAAALEKYRAQGAQCRLASLIFADQTAVPLGHEPVYLNGQIIGVTSSAAFGYRVQKPIALVLFKHPQAEHTQVLVEIAGQRYLATVKKGALYDPAGARMRTIS